MKLHHESHLFGQTIVREHFRDEYNELVELLTVTGVPLRSAGPFTTGQKKVPKRQSKMVRGERKKLLLPADLPALNEEFDKRLRTQHWSSQPYTRDDVFATTKDRSRGDFERNGVFVEVEFGNTASVFRDFFKFQVANRERIGEVAVLVTGTRQLMKFHDSGVTTFEKVQQTIPYLRIAVQMPVWIIGLEPDSWEPIRVRYNEMNEEATAHGDVCLTYDEAFGAPLPVDEELDELGEAISDDG
jgi:Restriction endonuclease BglII